MEVLKRILQKANFVANRVQSDTAMKLKIKFSVFLYEQTVGKIKLSENLRCSVKKLFYFN